ncbi:sporulation protein YabP [Oceanirhabdus sp. W0125-5]|uniref:sporulation protein YabP n=1 Tax=Oceanirhabdus sp. W0125-5 TaxID=2999116 RepID=UPI0022F30818|nr:sporulation protein YabP [Oceanirhabdus sp. W0125-5]WBW97937.1 sporulation protein YabP [Oceanirhabdus sp. W0125-5]
MDINREDKQEEMNCNLLLEDRKKLQITGVIEVIRFNEEEILLNTKLGTLLIKGENLKMNKLDVQAGEVYIVGSIDSCVYSNKHKAKSNEGILAKLFK